ncbi:Protein CBR-STR-252 [Caenorhabditis briggsae]|uniref:Protein CBR-STR-252 n=1 Tax=Caenorhabditis briggsae TaxID=6238 RepID=A8XD10_CAEBR|nr:Protein CBR-STR-252 [Caenorhabditis briggsae]CAP30528.2 Protein CBR-STR-252 [Caenorhabditis briggsae]
MQTVHTIIQRVAALVAVFNNLLLIFLIIFKSHRKVGKYKYLMIYISIFEIVYAIVDALAVPGIFTLDAMFVVVTFEDQVLVPDYMLASFGKLFCVFFGISMAIFAVHFIYRYLVLSGDTFLKEIGKNISDVRYVGPYFWPIGSDCHPHIHWNAAIGILIMTIAIIISFGFIIVFGFKCYWETKEMIAKATHSTSFHKLQSQLFYALVFQTVIPVILMHIPASAGFTAAFFNSSIEFLGDLPSITICLYPTLDPLPNFFIIKNYRDAITNCLRRLIGLKGATVDVGTTAMGSYAMTVPQTVSPTT